MPLAAILLALVVALAEMGTAQAGSVTNWSNAGFGPWTEPGNWDGGVPMPVEEAIVGNGGTAIVAAPGQTAGQLDIGLSGSGTLLVKDGGGLTVTPGGAVMLGTGAIAVAGTGSSLIVGADFIAGRGTGTSTVTVSDGARLITGRGFLGEAGFGPTLASTITATVTGPGTVWNAGSLIAVGGGAATATLTIADGAVVAAQDPVAISAIGAGGTGVAAVTGAGSRLVLGGTTTLAIGESFNGGTGNGMLTIRDGGFVSAGSVQMGVFEIAARGALVIEGTSGASSVLQTVSLTKGIGSAAVVFDNGILRAAGDSTSFISGFAPGDIVIRPGGATIDTNGYDVTASSSLAGPGTLTKAGLGTLFLTGDSVHRGSTIAQAGTLSIGNGATTGSIQGDVAVLAGATLAFNRSDTISFASVISGAGGMAQVGTGATILTAPNTFTGGTTITAGILQLGAGGTTGGILGDVTDQSVLAFNRADAVTFPGTISGRGAVSQIGPGSTTITASNTYTGGTTIAAGNLIGSATSFGSGPITDNAALVVIQPIGVQFGNDRFGNAIDGSGTFTKQGPGLLNYTGTGGLTGATVVQAGTLAVNGSLARSPVTVRSGATLSGNGTVGGVTVATGGTIAPGNSIGTLHVNGAFAQQPGSTYQVQVDPGSSAADLIIAGVNAAIADGAVLNVGKITAGTYSIGSHYTVLTAQGGISGTYVVTGDTALSAFLALTAAYDTNNAYLAVLQFRDLGAAAETPNQKAVANGLTSLPASNPLRTTALLSPTDESARQAYDQLSADGLASLTGVLVEDSRLAGFAALDRLRDTLCAPGDSGRRNPPDAWPPGCAPPTDRLSLWSQGFGGWDRTAGHGNASTVQGSVGGVLFGLDTPFAETWRAGAFAGYSRSALTADGGGTSAAADGYHLGLYGGTAQGRFGLRLGGGYTWYDIGASRHVTAAGFAQLLRSGYGAGSPQVFAEAGYRIGDGAVSIEPFLGADYVSFHAGGFTEQGGEAALTGQDQVMSAAFTTLGLRPAMVMSLGPIQCVVHGGVGWRHAFGYISPASTFAFAGGSAFTVAGVPIARDAAVIETGFDLTIAPNVSLGLGYFSQRGGGMARQSLTANLIVRF